MFLALALFFPCKILSSPSYFFFFFFTVTFLRGNTSSLFFLLLLEAIILILTLLTVLTFKYLHCSQYCELLSFRLMFIILHLVGFFPSFIEVYWISVLGFSFLRWFCLCFICVLYSPPFSQGIFKDSPFYLSLPTTFQLWLVLFLEFDAYFSTQL